MSEIRFGSYRITETLGGGALSTIYRAVQEPLGRVVALKVLKNQIAPTSPFGEQLERESKILADLTHPNVVLLIEAGRSSSGRPFLVLEHVDGPTVADLLEAGQTSKPTASAAPNPLRAFGAPKTTSSRPKAHGHEPSPISVTAALAIGVGVCSALEHVHGKGIVHRDIKPSNIILSRQGVVKIVDFGIAQRPRMASMSDDLGIEGITVSGRMAPEAVKDAFGTPAYMSPEQILGDFVDGRSDLFSLGVVLYQMISGVRPFDDDKKSKQRGAAQRIRRDAAVPLRERAPRCPRAVERIVMRLLEKSPGDRYASASLVRERLETALRAETREEAPTVVRRALVSGGFAEPEVDEAAPNQPRDRRQGRRSNELLRVFAGLGAITAIFIVAALVIESGASARVTEPGNRPLELLPTNAGGLRVVASPWAYVRVDGQLVETTPFARPIPLSAGRHWVTLTHPDALSPTEREVTIAAGETATLDVVMNMPMEDAGRDAH